MATRLYNVDEVVAFVNISDDKLDLSDTDQEDRVKYVDSDNGDAEKSDYRSSQLISSEFLSEPGLHAITALVEKITPDEPHLCPLIIDGDLPNDEL